MSRADGVDPSGERSVVAIACGGTGGHFYPGLSIAVEWQRRGGRAVLLIAGRHQATQIEEARHQGVEAIAVSAAKRPANLALYPAFAARLLQHVLQARGILRQVGAQAVLCMGSYASVPVGLAAAWTALPLLLHDGNAHMGRANAFLARWASATAQALPPPANAKRKAGPPPHIVGMPLRDELLEAALLPPLDGLERAMLCRNLDLDPGRPTLLVFGGSQGAQFINENLLLAIANWKPPAPFQAIHLTGRGATDAATAAWKKAGIPAHVAEFDPNIVRLYRLADFVVCRAGGSTVAELALLSKAALLIPLASATDDHQRLNAEAAVAVEGAVMLTEDRCTPRDLRDYLRRWLELPDYSRTLGQNLGRLARPDAAQAMADLIAAQIAGRPDMILPPTMPLNLPLTDLEGSDVDPTQDLTEGTPELRPREWTPDSDSSHSRS